MGEPKGEKEERVRKTGGKKGEGEEEGGCCCCDRGITSAPLTRKTFRLNLVLDSTRPPPPSGPPRALTPRPTPKRSSIFCERYETNATQILRIRFRFEVISINSGSVKWSSVESLACFMLVAINAAAKPATKIRNRNRRACRFNFYGEFYGGRLSFRKARNNVNEIKTCIVRISR